MHLFKCRWLHSVLQSDIFCEFFAYCSLVYILFPVLNFMFFFYNIQHCNSIAWHARLKRYLLTYLFTYLLTYLLTYFAYLLLPVKWLVIIGHVNRSFYFFLLMIWYDVRWHRSWSFFTARRCAKRGRSIQTGCLFLRLSDTLVCCVMKTYQLPFLLRFCKPNDKLKQAVGGRLPLYAPPLSSLCGHRSASRRRADRVCRPQRSIRSPTLTAAAAWRVNAAVSRAAWWPWPFDLESGVRVSCDVSYLCANFNLPRHLCSRVTPDVRDRQTDRRQRQTSDKYIRQQHSIIA